MTNGSSHRNTTHPPIALLTDFGIEDWFIGVMKGVINQISPASPIIDITHYTPNQNVLAGSFILWNAYSYFEEGTVFVGVVDPGVGSGRDVWAVTTDNYYFVLPDNGLINLVLSEANVQQVISVTEKDYMLDPISNTFHGRDIFAPVGAHIAAGVSPNKMGKTVTPPAPAHEIISIQQPGNYQGEIIYVDKFGNLITNLHVPSSVEGTITIKDTTYDIATTYSKANVGEPLGLIDSSNLLEVAVRNGNAAQTLKVNPPAPVTASIEEIEQPNQ